MIRKMMLLTMIGMALAVASANSQETMPPPLSFDRMYMVMGLGYAQYDENTEAAVGKAAGMSLLPGIAYSTGRNIQFAFSENILQSDVNCFEAGVRWMAVTDGTGQGGQLAIGVNGVNYHGGGVDALGGSWWSWNTGVYASYNIAGRPGKPLRWYLSGAAIHDPNKRVLPDGSELSSQTRFRADVRCGFGLKHLFQ